jgi:hypothetical protein
MLWRDTQTVAFGIKGKYVAAWYCSPTGKTNSNGAGVDSAKLVETFKANVLKSCLDLYTPPTGGAPQMYNICFNQRETAAHNAKRALHEAKSLTVKAEMAREVQRQLNALPRGEAVSMPAASARPAAYRECGENVFTTTERERVFTATLATEGWYAGAAQYDFATHAPKNPAATRESDQFT